MQRVKAWFLSGSLTILTLAGFHAAWALGQGGPWLAWAGALVAALAMPLRVGLYYLRATPTTAPSMPVLQGVTYAGAALALVGSAAQWPGVGPAVYALLGAAATGLYVYGYSRLGRAESAALRVGARLPEMVLTDVNGRAVDAAKHYAGSAVLMMFFRGNWCPLCMAQVRDVAKAYRALADRGVRVALVSPQPHDDTRALAARFDVPMDFWVDPAAQTARALGIVHEGGLPAGLEVFGYDTDTVLPTVVLADASGTVIFADQTDNYRVRPEPEVFLAVLDGRPLPV